MLQQTSHLLWSVLLLVGVGLITRAVSTPQMLLNQGGPTIERAKATTISVSLFAALERLARLVDISYCIGNTGVRKPFNCVSRCKDFPNLALVRTWHTGMLISDSCGYIAVDQGGPEGGADDGSDKLLTKPAIVVAFRGTYSIANTVMDLSTIPQEYVPYPSPDDGGDGPPLEPSHSCHNCTVHMGFRESWRSARKTVLPELTELRARYPSHPVVLVGHSLGGAVACLAALELRVSLGWEDISVTTFGEPRVGNYGFTRFVDEVFGLDGDMDLEDSSYRRVTHNSDPVPLLPPGEFGFRSHSGEIYISKKNLSPSETDLQTCIGDTDPACSAGGDSDLRDILRRTVHLPRMSWSIFRITDMIGLPTRFKLWQLFFAHRDYFWRIGLCVPGGDPTKWTTRFFGNGESAEL